MKPRTILAPIDVTPASRRALAYALDAARAAEAELTVLHVSALPLYVSPSAAIQLADATHSVSLETLTRTQAEAEMHAVLTEAQVPPSVAARSQVLLGDAVTVILDRVEHFDLTIVGTHGRRGIDHFFMGSVAEKIVRGANKPVITVRGGVDPLLTFPPRRILVPIDFSNGSRAALDFARQIARDTRAKVDLLHVLENVHGLDAPEELLVMPPGGEAPRSLIDYRRQRAARELEVFLTGGFDGALPGLTVEVGHPAEVILQHAERTGVDLVAMGTHGRTGWARIGVGSVAERVMRNAEIPVLTVRAAD